MTDPGKRAGDWQIGGQTRVFCVLGHPVGHTLSPAMHNAALRAMGIDGVYVAFDVAPADLEPALAGLQRLGVAGVNCTIPHKQALLSLLDEVSEEAARIGAANTVVFRDGRRIGHNTDWSGFLAALHAEGCEPEGKRALVIGAGGAARAVVYALLRAGATPAITNRSPERAAELAAEVRDWPGAKSIECLPFESGALGRRTRESDLIIQTTSIGMHPHEGESPPIPSDAFHPGVFIYELIYSPSETRLMRTARSRGARAANGAGMLARQGALALELWTGLPAPAGLMEQVVRSHYPDPGAAGHRQGAAPPDVGPAAEDSS